MKTRYLIPVLLLCAASVACNKEQSIPDGDTELMTLEASIGTPDTRLHFTGDQGSYTAAAWQDGDRIWVRSDTQPYWEDGDCFTTTASDISSDGHSAKFTGRSRRDGRMCAVYPYELVDGRSRNDVLLLQVPDTQAIAPGDAPASSLAAAAFWEDGSSTFSMEYIFGAVKFSLTGKDLKVSRFELVDAKGSNVLHGFCEVKGDYASKGIASAVMQPRPASNRLTLVPEAEVTLGAVPFEFYAVLPEGALGGGFVLKALDASGKTLAGVVSDKDNSVVRGKVVKMPTVQMAEAGGSGELFLEGSGIEADPYVISSASDLVTFSTLVNSETGYDKYAGKVFRQTADIDMNLKEFAPVGASPDAPFTGIYLGEGHGIANLATSGLDGDKPASGLFSYAEGATIKGVKLSGRSNTGAFNRVGGLVGLAKNCTITDCHLSSSELGASANMCAGLVAEMSGGVVSSSSVNGCKLVNTKNYAAGIVAYAHDGAKILSCSVSGTDVSAGNEVGGIVGKLDAGIVEQCHVSASEVSAGEEDAGGIAGWVVAESTISDSHCDGATKVSVGKYYAGGIVGLIQLSTVKGCKVSACEIGGGQRNGGIAGYMKATPSAIEDCSLEGGSVVGGSLNIGGITGWMDLGTISGCCMKGSKINATGDGAGGIVGRAISKSGGSNVIDKCWIEDSEISGTYSVAGIVGYSYPDAGGVLVITNSGVRSGVIHPTLCDTGGDPAKGDCMSGGILGWMRLSDAGSKAYVYNCYSHVSEGGFACDLPMSHPSLGGLVGYGSISSTGEVVISNCVSSLRQSDILLAGKVISDTGDASCVGALFGKLPNSSGIKVSDCHYMDGLSAGVAGESVVREKLSAYGADAFYGNAGMLTSLNAFVEAGAAYSLSPWTFLGNVPVVQ